MPCLVATAIALGAAASAQIKKPNILVIWGDDVGVHNISAYNHGYNISESFLIFGGYRHTAVDYQNGGFVYDAAASGPILGLTIQW